MTQLLFITAPLKIPQLNLMKPFRNEICCNLAPLIQFGLKLNSMIFLELPNTQIAKMKPISITQYQLGSLL